MQLYVQPIEVGHVDLQLACWLTLHHNSLLQLFQKNQVSVVPVVDLFIAWGKRWTDEQTAEPNTMTLATHVHW